MFNKILSSISTVTNQGAPASFKFVINERVESFAHSLFELYSGKPKSGIINIPGIPIQDMSKLDVSVFVFRKSQSSSQTSFALHSMKKLVSLRHPCILKVLDCAESDSGIYIATEHVVPLSLLPRSTRAVPIHGIFQIAKAIEFIHDEARLVHGSIDPVTIFVTDGGSFRLGGFELARPSPLDSNYYYDKRNVGSGILSRRVECKDLNDVDSFSFVLLVNYLCQGPVLPSSITEGSSVTLTSLCEAVGRELIDNPPMRQLVIEISRCRFVSRQLSVFHSNETVQICDYLDSIHVHGDDANRFLESLPGRLARVDETTQQGVILDLILTNVLSIASLVPAAILVITSIASRMPKDVFRSRVQPKLVELFSIQDRSVRFRLLTGISDLVSLIDEAVLEKQILTETLTGCTDSHPSIREQTLKSVVEISCRISTISVIEKKIIPNIIKLLRDPEASIRTNAMVSIAKVAALLGSGSDERQRDLLGQVLVGGLKDPFGPARLVAIQSLETYPVRSELDASKMINEFLPLLCPLVLDREVGSEAYRVLQQVVGDRIKSYIPRPITQPVRNEPVMIEPAAFSFATPAPAPSVGMSLTRPPTKAAPQPVKKLSETDFDSFWDDVGNNSKSNISYNNSLI